MTRIAFTGHRTFTDLESLDTDDLEHEFSKKLIQKILHSDMDPDDLVFVTGAALGVDTWAATYAMESGIPLHLYLPFPAEVQMEKAKMTPWDREVLKQHLAYAEKVEVVNEYFSLKGYGARNRALVDNSDILWAYYTRKKSGSGHCVRYYVKIKKRPAFNLKTGLYDIGAVEKC